MTLTPSRELPPELQARLADRLARARARTTAQALAPRPAGAPRVLSSAQRRLWFLDQLQPGSAAYNIPVAWRLHGPIDAAALAAALQALVERHEVLRTRYPAHDGAPLALVDPATAVRLRVVDVADDGAALALVEEEGRTPFDLACDAPLRATLGLLPGGREAVLVLVLHHIAADGWSIGLIAGELGALSRGEPLPQPGAQYADAAHWQAREPHPARLAYWRGQLADAPTVLELPADRPRPPRPSGRGAILRSELGSELAHAVRELATREEATPYAVLLAAFCAACARWSGSADVVVGVPVAGRDEAGVAGLVGCFVNTLPLRVRLPAGLTGRELVAAVRAGLLGGLEHELPFEQLVEALGVERDRSTTPLVQALFVGTDVPRSPLRLASLEAEDLPVDPGAAKLDLSLGIETTGAMPLALTYSTDLLDGASARRLAEQYRTLLAALVAEPDRAVATLALGTVEERPARTAGEPGSVLALYREALARTPDAPAVADRDGELSYRELHARASAVAAELRRRGAAPDTRVGLLAERSAGAVVGLLGILLAGAAYVPVDPAEPPRRADLMLTQAGARLVVGERALRERLAGRDVVCVDDDQLAPAPTAEVPAVDPASLAYVVFTSGSTGVPKGVAIEHRQLRAYVDSILPRLGVPAGSSFAVASTLAADLGHTSVFSALCSGGLLRVLARDEAADPAAFAAHLRRRPVDVLKLVPSHLAALLSGPDPAGVLPRRRLVLGGEALAWPLVERVRELAPGLAILNHYGPTEATVGALTCEVPASRGGGASVPVGEPLPHAVARVLDAALQPVPAGVPGELYLGGASLARGYLGDEQLTAARFVRDPFDPAPGARLYRTGDLVRRLADGSIQFLGRADDQVKLRGYRIEPGEVAAALREQPGVRDAHALVLGERLVAYVAGDADGDALRAALAERLPSHLVPGAIVVLDALPLTANGKVDRRALPAPPAREHRRGARPGSAVQQAVAAIWAELLAAEEIGLDDDFFALGGHSLLATRVAAHVRRDLGVEVPLSAVFESPTLGGLAEVVETLRWAARRAPVAAAAGDYEEGEL